MVSVATTTGTVPGLILGGAAVGGALGVLAHVVTHRPQVLTADDIPAEVAGKDAS